MRCCDDESIGRLTRRQVRGAQPAQQYMGRAAIRQVSRTSRVGPPALSLHPSREALQRAFQSQPQSVTNSAMLIVSNVSGAKYPFRNSVLPRLGRPVAIPRATSIAALAGALGPGSRLRRRYAPAGAPLCAPSAPPWARRRFPPALKCGLLAAFFMSSCRLPVFPAVDGAR